MSYRSFKRLLSSSSAVKRRGNTLLLQSAGSVLLTTAVEFPTKAAAKHAGATLVQALRSAVYERLITTDQQFNLACGAWLDEAVSTLNARVRKGDDDGQSTDSGPKT